MNKSTTTKLAIQKIVFSVVVFFISFSICAFYCTLSRTRVVGAFPDGNSALMLVCARLRHVAGTQWGNKKYMNMKHLEVAFEDAFIVG